MPNYLDIVSQLITGGTGGLGGVSAMADDRVTDFSSGRQGALQAKDKSNYQLQLMQYMAAQAQQAKAEEEWNKQFQANRDDTSWTQGEHGRDDTRAADQWLRQQGFAESSFSQQMAAQEAYRQQIAEWNEKLRQDELAYKAWQKAQAEAAAKAQAGGGGYGGGSGGGGGGGAIQSPTDGWWASPVGAWRVMNSKP
mgnify:CR=1 FL=1